MISRWPLGTGIVVDRGTAYFGAGLFPKAGVSLLALNAKNGAIQWKRTLDVSAQGYLSASPELLVVPTGRTSPVLAALSDGKPLGKLPGGTGGAYALSVAHGRLFASTDRGAIYCFSASGRPLQKKKRKRQGPRWKKDGRGSEDMARVAGQILQSTGVRKGYCLMLGCQQGRLAFELAQRSDLRIVVVEPDAERVPNARRMLDAAGVYGVRVTIHEGALDSLPYPPYFANLVVSERALLEGELTPRFGKSRGCCGLTEGM